MKRLESQLYGLLAEVEGRSVCELLRAELENTSKYRLVTKLGNHEVPGPATADQLQASAPSVRVFYLSAGTVPMLHPLLCIPSHAVNQTMPRCCWQSELFSQRIRAKTPNYLCSKKKKIILEPVPDLIRIFSFTRVGGN